MCITHQVFGGKRLFIRIKFEWDKLKARNSSQNHALAAVSHKKNAMQI